MTKDNASGAGMDPHAHWITSADGLSRRNPAPDASAPRMPTSPTITLKVGNEFAPFHRSASHVEPAYRDGWNQCYQDATRLLAESQAHNAKLEASLTAMCDLWRMVCSANHHDPHHMVQYTEALAALQP
jgi:hypothetical protein